MNVQHNERTRPRSPVAKNEAKNSWLRISPQGLVATCTLTPGFARKESEGPGFAYADQVWLNTALLWASLSCPPASSLMGSFGVHGCVDTEPQMSQTGAVIVQLRVQASTPGTGECSTAGPAQL